MLPKKKKHIAFLLGCLWHYIKKLEVKEFSDGCDIMAEIVVRCRECDNCSEVDGQHYCKFWRMYCPDDSEFFCKAGQRKEADHDKHSSNPV